MTGLTEGRYSSPAAFYEFLSESGFRVLGNILFNGSPGAQLTELDYFLRKRRCGHIPTQRGYLWIQKRTEITVAMAEVYGRHFYQYNLGMLPYTEIYDLAAKVTRMMPELSVDVGLTQVKNAVLSRDNSFVSYVGDGLYYTIPNEDVIQAYRDYYTLKSHTLDFDPWTPASPAIEGELADLLGGKLDRMVVVHFRTATGNAGLVIPPETLFPSLEYLRDCGFTIVKGGTEQYPEEFRRFGVIDYSSSPLRSFRNDLAVLSHCKLALINSSGLENLVDFMGIPLVSYARWHLSVGPFSSKAVIVPSLLCDPQDQRPITFGEQILMFKTRPEFGKGHVSAWSFPSDRYVPRNPEPDELLAAVQEALALRQAPGPVSPLQARFNQLDENGLLPLMQSRISEFFLTRFAHLL